MATEKIKELTRFLAEYTVMLSCSGANTERVIRSANEVANYYGYESLIVLFHRTISLTVYDPNDYNERRVDITRQLPANLNLAIVNELSSLPRIIEEENLSIKEARDRYKEMINQSYNKVFLVMILASFANGALCKLFGGDILSVAVVFTAVLISFPFRILLPKYKVDVKIMMFFVSFISSTLAWLLGTYVIPTETLDVAISTSVLFLIPGVPIINTVIDLLDGHILYGMARAIDTIIIMISISVGLYSMLAFQRWVLL